MCIRDRNTALLCTMMIVIGYSSYALIVIRSTANTPMDQNSPEDIDVYKRQVLWLLEAYLFQSLTPRSFCGALLGWMLPYWMLFGHAFFYNEIELFYRPFNQLLTIGEFFNLAIFTIISGVITVLGYFAADLILYREGAIDVYKRQILQRDLKNFCNLI